MIHLYEAVAFIVDEHDKATIIVGPALVFASSERNAERSYIIEHADKLDYDMEDLTVLVRPFAQGH